MVADEHEKLEEDHKQLRIDYFQVKQDADELKEKMKFFTKVQIGQVTPVVITGTSIMVPYL